MKKIIGILCLLLAMPLMAQNVRWDLPVTTVQAQGGNLLPVYAVPGALVSFYNEPSGTLANTYNSATSTSPCPTGSQVVLNGSAACVSSADPYGNMGAWFLPGQYMATITGAGRSYDYYFTIAGSGGGLPAGPSFAVNFANSAVNAFQGDPNITINPTTHSLDILGYNALTALTGQAQENTFTVSQFGGLPATVILNAENQGDVTCTGGSTTVTTATTTPFTAGMVGDAIVLANCGQPNYVSKNANGQLLATGFATTIAAYNNSSSITVATAPPLISGMLTSAIYVSGLTVASGTAGSCTGVTFNNGSSATATLTVTGGVITPTMAISAVGTGATSPPTSGSTGTCAGVTLTGTPVYSTTLAPASVSNVWAAVGPDATAAVTGCVSAANAALYGQCYFPDGTNYLMSSTGQMTQALTSHTKIHIGGDLIFAPQSSVPISESVNGLVFNISSAIGLAGNCPSTTGTICQIANAVATGATSFTATSSADAGNIPLNDWLILEESLGSPVNDVGYIDWVQPLSVSGATVNLKNPTTESFPNTHTWIAPGSASGFGWRTVTTLDEGVTVEGGKITVPPLVDASSGRSIVVIYTTAAKDFTWQNQTIEDPSGFSAEIQYDYGDKISDIIEHSGHMEYAKSINGRIQRLTADHIAMALNNGLGACFGYNASYSSGILIDLGSQLHLTDSEFINMCGGGIAAQYNVHDSYITGNHVHYIPTASLFGGSAAELVGLSLTGDINVFAQGNTFNGADGANSNVVSVGNSGGTPGVLSDSNDVSNQRACLPQGTSTCFQGTPFRMGGTLKTDRYDQQNYGTNGMNHPGVETFAGGLTAGVAGMVTPFSLVGITNQGLGMQYGSNPAAIESWCGTAYSTSAILCAFNAIQTSSGMWYQAYSGAGYYSTLDLHRETGFFYYIATFENACTISAPCSFATFWGNPISQTTVAGALTLSGAMSAPDFQPSILHSAAGTALPTCASGVKGQLAVVSDATSPTYMTAYTSGGAITAAVICSYNGTTYSWLTY